jgi:2'-5' RNA ligase
MNSNDFPEVYKALGINLAQLGCVMADLEWPNIECPTWVKDYLHTSTHPDRFWINGWIAEANPHVTILYGLLQKAKNIEWHIGEVLSGWKLDWVELENFSYFESPYPDEPYYCVIAHIKKTLELLEGHQRLSFLPHINTFPEYTPHMTVAYIKKEQNVLEAFLEDLKEYQGNRVIVTSINLGK